MLFKSKFFRVASAFCLLLSISLFSLADTIRLKDGSIIKGRIISFGEGKFTVLIGEGPRQRQMVFFADEIETIEFDGTSGVSTIKTSLPTRPDANKTDIDKPDTKVITVNPTPTPAPTPSKSVIITDSTTQPTATPTPKPTPNTTVIVNPTPSPTPVSTPTPTLNKPKPIVLNVKVLADSTANGWTNTQWVVKKGQKIRITAKGQINLGSGRYASPAGLSSVADPKKLIPTQPTGGLIAVIGDDNNEFFFIGATREFVAQRDGSLFLGVNEENLDDNSGAFDVTIEIETN